ncbi:MAG: integrase, partial [Beggiatoa sp.]|nr:integrase [Beggiatoa sp.]
MDRDVFPWFGARPIGEITTPELRSCLRRIVDRGAIETARRLLQNLSRIFRYAISNDQAENDHAADLRGAFT